MLTSYFARLKSIPENIIPISICGKCPDWYKGLEYKKLAPTYDIFIEYKNSGNEEKYTKRFKEEILSQLSVDVVLSELYELAKSTEINFTDIVLICFEKSDAFCHRHLIADWINDSELESCKEMVFEKKEGK